MRSTDAERLLGALLGNATGLRPARRRSTAPRRLAGVPGGTALARTAISVLGGIAIEVIRGMNQAQPAPPPPPRQAARPVPAPARRLPSVDAREYAPPADSSPDGADSEARETLLLLRAMIAAARADGAIDADERRAIAGRMDAAGLSAAERDLVLAEFANPLAIEALAAQVADPVAAAQLYAASVVAMGDIASAERLWLDRLGAALHLSPQATRGIEERLSA